MDLGEGPFIGQPENEVFGGYIKCPAAGGGLYRRGVSLSLYGSSVRGTWRVASLLGTPKVMKGGL